jgi:hypothetical protein
MRVPTASRVPSGPRRTGGDQADGAKRIKKEAGVNDAAAVEKEVS